MWKKYWVKYLKGILPSLSVEVDLNELRNVSWLDRRLTFAISACGCQNTS
jgi:hypothetical protein